MSDESSAEFHTVAAAGSIPEGEGRCFVVNGKMIAIFYRDGQYFAINDSCPHMGASLSAGYLDGHDVICPWHAWKFCIKDGLWMDNPKSQIRTPTYEVRVHENDLQVLV
ncbi:MAG: Rieske (2Fe-2S) protein [Planctomycetes bacterium]|nr:Rieske (2Fe-2S) protein [Planctomycetota bacterium]